LKRKNKQLVLTAFDTLLNKRDRSSTERYWSLNYIQHSAHIEPGREGLFNLIESVPPTWSANVWQHVHDQCEWPIIATVFPSSTRFSFVPKNMQLNVTLNITYWRRYLMSVKSFAAAYHGKTSAAYAHRDSLYLFAGEYFGKQLPKIANLEI
jgi:hypothetical protein